MSYPPQSSAPFGPSGPFGTPPPPPARRPRWLRAFLLGLVVPGVVISVVMGVVTLVKPQVVLGAVGNPLVWAFIGGALVVGVVVGLLVRLLRGPGWLAFSGFWLPVVVATAYGVAPAFIVTSVDEKAPPAALAPPSSAGASASPAPVAGDVGQAALTGIGHKASGTARLIRTADGTYVVRFENFKIEQGPDFRIHLVPGAGARNPGKTPDLGGLKASSGNQNYPVPAGTAVSAPTTILIWCRAFQVPVAQATIR
ncbi:hypothetical protein GCM10009765_17480 [Fodinicola feengrottensis]|uniref:DM13 domain-containing protein n=1 Tax=Fodinicola feengrottensis TaxID=435914 RepID=A0ABP4SAF3_9ACTN